MAAASVGNCKVCRESIFGSHVATETQKYHKDCFLCHQCLEPFKNNAFFEAEGGFYCESDFNIMFGPRCAKCGEVIVGKCVSALDAKWHIEHFNCDNCGKSLVGASFIRKDDKPYCKMCPSDAKKQRPDPQAADACENCHKPIVGPPLVHRGAKYHAHHFTCTVCHETLTPSAREYEGDLYCPADFDRILSQMCAACRRPITGRTICAIGRNYHPEHFVCYKCEKTFDGTPYFEYQSRPYCETHYKELTGSVCLYCRSPAKGNVVSALGGRWCEQHFMCMTCFTPMADGKVKFMEWDAKPVCKRCFEKLPSDVRRNLNKYKDSEKKYAAAATAAAAEGGGGGVGGSMGSMLNLNSSMNSGSKK
ncbi:hypothetical protein BC831DRAFT_425508 [Entophlyctis helioformis]|nr:hypothetical protein BC831DRAFT_425508 [Entophlyctis helioformis]